MAMSVTHSPERRTTRAGRRGRDRGRAHDGHDAHDAHDTHDGHDAHDHTRVGLLQTGRISPASGPRASGVASEVEGSDRGTSMPSKRGGPEAIILAQQHRIEALARNYSAALQELQEWKDKYLQTQGETAPLSLTLLHEHSKFPHEVTYNTPASAPRDNDTDRSKKRLRASEGGGGAQTPETTENGQHSEGGDEAEPAEPAEPADPQAGGLGMDDLDNDLNESIANPTAMGFTVAHTVRNNFIQLTLQIRDRDSNPVSGNSRHPEGLDFLLQLQGPHGIIDSDEAFVFDGDCGARFTANLCVATFTFKLKVLSSLCGRLRLSVKCTTEGYDYLQWTSIPFQAMARRDPNRRQVYVGCANAKMLARRSVEGSTSTSA